MNLGWLLRQILMRRGGGRSWPFPGQRPRRKSGFGRLILILLVAGFFYWQYSQRQARAPRQNQETSRTSPSRTPSRPPVRIEQPKFDQTANPQVGEVPPVEAPTGDDGGIGRLFRDRQSNVIVTAAGTVAKVLPDDNETLDGSSRHQRFIVRLANSGTLLLSHNLDLSARIPATEGDVIRFKGEYEWTERGGVVHWTHRDSARRHADGWIEHDGRRYE